LRNPDIFVGIFLAVDRALAERKQGMSPVTAVMIYLDDDV
jgi:hypothetical protein